MLMSPTMCSRGRCVGRGGGGGGGGVCRLLCVVLVCVAAVLLTTEAADEDNLHQRIEYHLSELKKGLSEVRHTRLHKRSASRDYDEIIFKSLTSFCYSLHSGNDVGVDPSEPRNHTRTSPSPGDNDQDRTSQNGQLTEWTGTPDINIFPVRVEAVRGGEFINVQFSVRHIGPGYVFRADSLEFSNYSIDYPSGSGKVPVLSLVHVTVDATVCRDKAIADDVKASYAFMTKGDKSGKYVVFASLDICMFDRVWNESVEYEHTLERWQVQRKAFSQDLPPPLFKLVPEIPDNEIIIKRNQNVSLDVDLQLFHVRQMKFHAAIWDRDLKKMLLSTTTLRVRHSKQRGITVENAGRDSRSSQEEKSLVSIKILEEKSTNASKLATSQGYKTNITARVQVTVNTQNGRRSGYLSLLYQWREPEYYQRPVVRYLETSRTLELKLAHRRKAFPRNVVDITKREPFECDKMGTRYYSKESTNCTIMCYAFGPDIRSISIKRAKGVGAASADPVKSFSYVIDSIAYVKADIGPASKYNDGRYQCVVKTKSGKERREDMFLYTRLFTNVTHLSMERVEYIPRTFKLSCVVFGVRPLNVTVEIYDENGNSTVVDDKDDWRFQYSRKEFGDYYTNVTAFIHERDLVYPQSYISCIAHGKRGSDSYQFYLSNLDMQQYPDPPEVDKMPNATYVTKYGNGTVKISCSARGRPPLVVRISVTEQDSRASVLDSSVTFERYGTQTDTRTSQTLLVPVEAFTVPNPRISCQAMRMDLGQEDSFEIEATGIF